MLYGALCILPTLRAQPPTRPPLPLEGAAPMDSGAANGAPGDSAVGQMALDSSAPLAAVPTVTYSDAALKPGEDAKPGTRVELDFGDDTDGPSVSYRWVQIEGPKVA